MYNNSARLWLLNKIIAISDQGRRRRGLSFFGTWLARKHIHPRIEIIFDELWICGVDGNYVILSDSFEFPYVSDSFIPEMLERSKDYWFYLYKPSYGDIIVDVGAGVGYDTMLFSKSIGRHGKVLSIEAHPKTYLSLQLLCKWNRLHNVTTLQCAVMDKYHKVFISSELNPDLNSIVDHESVRSESYPVIGKSLDQICNEANLDRIDYLKMNIEGAERLALDGAKSVISKTRYVTIACHDFITTDPSWYETYDYVASFLRNSGYDIFIRKDDERDYVRYHVHGINRNYVI